MHDCLYFVGFSGNYGGSLYLENTPITRLPDNFKVGGHLVLRHTPITKLPEGLKVGGYLDLENTQITHLPDNLKVEIDVYLKGSGVPKGTKKPKGVKGTLFW